MTTLSVISTALVLAAWFAPLAPALSQDQTVAGTWINGDSLTRSLERANSAPLRVSASREAR